MFSVIHFRFNMNKCIRDLISPFKLYIITKKQPFHKYMNKFLKQDTVVLFLRLLFVCQIDKIVQSKTFSMNVTESLNIAFENVAYNGDKTWSNGSHTYQKANLDLYTRERKLRFFKHSSTVKESIPTTKLAQYDYYRCHENRGIPYDELDIPTYFTPLRFSKDPEGKTYEEPWMLPEVEDMYFWFLNTYRIKSKWDMNIVLKDGNKKSMMMYRSPLGTFYATGESDNNKKYEMLYNWLTPEQNSDMKTIKELSQSIESQIKNIQNIDVKLKEKLKIDEPSKRLYSAVLQGIPSDKPEELTLDNNLENKPETLLCLPMEKLKNTIVNAVSNLPKHVEDKNQSSDESILNDVAFLQSNTIEDTQLFNNEQVLTLNSPPKVCNGSRLIEEAPSTFLNSYSNFLQNINFGQQQIHNIQPINNNTYTNNYQYSSQTYHQTNNCIYSNNNTYCNVVTNRSSIQQYSRNYIPNSYPTYPMMIPQNRAMYPPQGYVQQTQNFYNQTIRPVQNLQSTYTRNISSQRMYPQHYMSPPVQWVQQQCYGDMNQGSRLKIKSRKMTNPQVTLMQNKVKMKPPGLERESKKEQNKFLTSQNHEPNPKIAKTDEIQEVVSTTLDVQEDRTEGFLPVQVSMSEVLEMEALEQYNPSNENVYLDLERQAAEQYDPYSENLKGA